MGGSQRISVLLARRLGRRVRPGRARPRASRRTRTASSSTRTGTRCARGAWSWRSPPTLAGRIAYDPPLPAARDQLTQRMPLGSVIKCVAVYDEPFWRADGPQRAGPVRHGPDQDHLRQLAARRPAGGPARLRRGRRRARELTRRSAARARPRRVGGASPATSGPRARPAARAILEDWSEAEWTRGCYEALRAAGGPDRATATALRAPVGRIHWAGTETATYWTGYMDGAVSSGERAAREVLARL